MHLLGQTAVFLLAAVLVVPLFRRFGLGAVLGYLVAGMIIGPWGLGLSGDLEATRSIAEFGVVLLLFLIGLELQPTRLWALRKPVFGLGSAQVGFTTAVFVAAGLLLGMPWRAALVAGVGLALSSTALILASLAERRELTTRHGRDAFAILLFQDVAVIPILALLPLLAMSSEAPAVHVSAALRGVATIVAVVIASRLVIRPVLRLVATYGGREVFTAAALLLVVAAALLMEALGLSTSMGSFLAGVLLADSEYRHELEADIEPFKGLLLGLFFVTVGMSADLGLALASPLQVLGLAAGILIGKAAILYGLARGLRLPHATSGALAANLAAGGEFAFVVFGAAAALGVLGAPLAGLLVLAVTVSLLLAPLLIAGEDALRRRATRAQVRPFDTIDEPGNPVVIAGFGRFGQIVARVLRMCGVPFTALDASTEQVDFVRQYGNRIYYGDATRLELLEAAKVGEARLFVLAVDDVDASVRTAELMRRHFPHVPVLARARNRPHAFRLRDQGVSVIHRETLPASLDVARQALLRLGFGIAASERAVALFREHDEALMQAQYAVHHDEAQLIEMTTHGAAQLREVFEADAVGPMDFPRLAPSGQKDGQKDGQNGDQNGR